MIDPTDSLDVTNARALASTAAVPNLQLIPTYEIARVRVATVEPDIRLALVSDMCRANALSVVKRAGSGHLGSSFSAMDVVVHLLLEELNTAEVGWDDPARDVYFSSKGHDVPGLYAVLHALGVIPTDRFVRLRRLGGLDGHPDIGVPGIEANSGSLGMGISKGRGMVLAKLQLGLGGRVVVMTGDGELQEGQNWEALQAAAHDGLGRLWVVVDRNELQSDRPTEEILAIEDLEAKLRAFGWEVAACDGHDHSALRATFAAFRAGPESVPKALVAHTIKGKGVSFMEHPVALVEGRGTYRWHAGAPDDETFARAWAEIVARIEVAFASHGLGPLALEDMAAAEGVTSESLEGEPASGAGAPKRRQATNEYVVDVYGEALVEIGGRNERVVVLDADLASDCRVRAFELAYPERFVECGIAEQDMVSTAGGLARQGLLPVVNSFASFLASRANEQIYNNASEGTKVVYALHYAGLIPAGPGKSHQSVRDISLLSALPNLAVVQPCNADETRQALVWALEEAEESVALRLAIGPSPRPIALPHGYRLEPGRGVGLREGADALVLAYGPVMLHEALAASEILTAHSLRVAVVNMPWLNRLDSAWLEEAVRPHERIFVVEDHAPVGGLGDALRRALPGRELTVFGVEGWPACGTPQEALRFHGLDGTSLAGRISATIVP
jgi:transketolase